MEGCRAMNQRGTMEIPVNIRITDKDIANILHKALDEGGSLHWCYDVIVNGGTILLYGMDGSNYDLTKDKLMFGLQQSLPYLGKVISDTNLDTASIDHEGADLIIQLALFQTIKY